MDQLTGRRKRGPNPGTRAFGEMAEVRRDALKRGGKRADLRVKTAYKTAKAGTRMKNRYLSGD